MVSRALRNMIRVVHPESGSRIRILTLTHPDPGSRGQKGTGTWIPDPDPQNCIRLSLGPTQRNTGLYLRVFTYMLDLACQKLWRGTLVEQKNTVKELHAHTVSPMLQLAPTNSLPSVTEGRKTKEGGENVGIPDVTSWGEGEP
jgi:hypothetical protein